MIKMTVANTDLTALEEKERYSFKMVQFINLDMKTDFVYKTKNYEWKFTVCNKLETVENIIENILSEEVSTIASKELIQAQQLDKLKPPLEKMLSKKSSINKQLENLIVKNKNKEESGLSVGLLIFPFLQKLIPFDLIGGSKNRHCVLILFKKALKSGLKDKIPLKSLMKGLKTKPICWLESVQSNDVKIVLLAKLVKWLWKVTKSLIASKYYVTETQGSFKLIYIPKKLWQSRGDQKLNSMIHLGILQPVQEEEVKALEAKRRPAVVRWLPKSEGLRPIIFLKKDPNEGRSWITKRKDNELRAFLRFLMDKTNNPTRLRPQQLHKVWRSAVTKLGGEQRQKAHLVTVDVKDAYGSIIQEMLVGIVRLAATKYFKTHEVFIRFNIKQGYKKDVFTCVGLCKATEKKSTNKESIVKVKDLLERVDHIVKCQTVKRMKKSYLLRKGISQAVPVSAALCDLYLSYFTRTALAEFTSNKEDSLVRTMDDFLFITPDKDRAQLFLEKMSAGFPNSNIYIKQGKTQSTLAGNSSIDYFGYTFDTNMEVFVKYNDGADLSFRYTMTFTYKMTPIDTLVDKMKRIPTHKLTKLTVDAAYISVKAVCWNVFNTACLMACCFKATVSTISSHLFDNDKLFNCVISSSASVAAKTFRLRAKNDIFKRELFWISVRAFFLCCGSLLPSLQEKENEARRKVRPGLIEHISSFVEQLPSQFKTGC